MVGVGLGRLLLILVGVVATTTPGYSLAICVDSKEVALRQRECIQHGTEVMGRYFKQVQHDDGAVFGFQGKEDAAAILCDRAAKGLVFFSVASTDETVCSLNIQKLKKDF